MSARGWCAAHYSNWQRHGDPLYVRKFKKNEKCSVEGCERKQHAKDLCTTHWMKLNRSGTLNPIRNTKEYKERWLDARITEVSKIDRIRPLDPKKRGFHATNIISGLKQKARARGIDWTLEPLEAYRLIKSNCYYCGFVPNWPETRCGIDRIDNFKGYHKDNVVPCCYSCNTAKGIKTQDEFKLWASNLYNNFCL